MNYPAQGMDVLIRGNWKLLFTVTVETKENKFRTTFSNLMGVMAGNAR